MAEKGKVAKERGTGTKSTKTGSSLYAVIRVRGPVNVRKDIEDTLKMLRLDRVNHCVLVPSNPTYQGMLHKAEECITWGEISKQTLEKLIFKRGLISGSKVEKKGAAELAKKVIANGIKETDIKPVFRLNPPSRGYRAVRSFYPKGALGCRGGKINELLKRMI